MFAGKSTKMINMMNRIKNTGDSNCVIIKYKYDKRYSENNLVTHDGIMADYYTI
jgi:thymidine kinase